MAEWEPCSCNCPGEALLRLPGYRVGIIAHEVEEHTWFLTIFSDLHPKCSTICLVEQKKFYATGMKRAQQVALKHLVKGILEPTSETVQAAMKAVANG